MNARFIRGQAAAIAAALVGKLRTEIEAELIRRALELLMNNAAKPAPEERNE